MSEKFINNGCILIARQILNSDVWHKPAEYLKVFFYILAKVNHGGNEYFPRGTNFFNFSEERIYGVSKTQVYDFIRWAKSSKIELITTKKTTRGVVIKVNNYDTYQNLDNYKSQNRIQHEEQPQTPPLYESSEPKEPKRFKPPALEEVETYCKERNNEINAQRFIDFYESKGWLVGRNKMRDWKAAVRTWENKDKKNKVVPIKNNTTKQKNNDAFYMELSRRL